MKLFSNAVRVASITTRGPDDPGPCWKTRTGTSFFSRDAQPRGSKVLLIQQVKEYLQENYTQRITLNSAAALVYLTPTISPSCLPRWKGWDFPNIFPLSASSMPKEALLDYHRRIR